MCIIDKRQVMPVRWISMSGEDYYSERLVDQLDMVISILDSDRTRVE